MANIVFQRIGSGTSGAATFDDTAAIQFQNYTSGAAGSGAFAYQPTSANRTAGTFEGDVWINVSLAANVNPQVLDFGFSTLTHEIGHAIGLSHPGTYNANPITPITYNADAEYYEDSLQYTVMSYFGAIRTGGNFGSNLPG